MKGKFQLLTKEIGSRNQTVTSLLIGDTPCAEIDQHPFYADRKLRIFFKWHAGDRQHVFTKLSWGTIVCLETGSAIFCLSCLLAVKPDFFCYSFPVKIVDNFETVGERQQACKNINKKLLSRYQYAVSGQNYSWQKNWPTNKFVKKFQEVEQNVILGLYAKNTRKKSLSTIDWCCYFCLWCLQAAAVKNHIFFQARNRQRINNLLEIAAHQDRNRISAIIYWQPQLTIKYSAGM